MTEKKQRSDRYSSSGLTEWVTRTFDRAGVSGEDAAQTAEILVRTSLRGIDTHGVSRVPMYIDKVLSGEVNGQPRRTSEFRDGVLYYDGDGGIGQAVGASAVAAAVSAAQDKSVVPCVISRSGHLAAIGMFALLAAEAEMMAVLCQETPPLMAPVGSSRAAIGNNPIAFSLPMGARPPLVFDMATSVVARGSVLDAVREQRQIPEHWAIGPDGLPTTDPATALRGSMLPVAGHKGVGLAMLVQALAGSLSGSMSAASAATYGAQSSAGNVSAFLLVINPDRMVGREAFAAHVADWVSTYQLAAGPDARYPGERAGQCEQERRAAGIPIPAPLAEELRATGDKVSSPFRLSPL
ncbi:MAG: Ldh family oxidoreductase [Steroidobacteraceae bacterium]